MDSEALLSKPSQPSFRLMIGSSLTQREVNATATPTDVTSAKAVAQNLRTGRGAGLVVEVLDMASMPRRLRVARLGRLVVGRESEGPNLVICCKPKENHRKMVFFPGI